jgi:hypothetical protein
MTMDATCDETIVREAGTDISTPGSIIIEQESGFTVVVSAGRISSRLNATQVASDALDYEGARFLAKSLALATGGEVHVTYTNRDGEHNLRAHPDQFPGVGPGAIDRSFLLPR